MKALSLFDLYQVCQKSESDIVCKVCNHTKTQVTVCGTCLARLEDKRDKEIQELVNEIHELKEKLGEYVLKEREWRKERKLWKKE